MLMRQRGLFRLTAHHPNRVQAIHVNGGDSHLSSSLVASTSYLDQSVAALISARRIQAHDARFNSFTNRFCDLLVRAKISACVKHVVCARAILLLLAGAYDLFYWFR